MRDISTQMAPTDRRKSTGGNGHVRHDGRRHRAEGLRGAVRAEPERNRGAAAQIPRHAARGAHRRECGNEGLQPPPRDDEAVQQPGEAPDQQHDRQGGPDAQATRHEKRPGERGRERQDGSDREVNAARDDDRGHAGSENAFLGHLSQDVGEVADIEEHEAPAPHGREDDGKQHHGDEPQQAAEPRQETPGAREWGAGRPALPALPLPLLARPTVTCPTCPTAPLALPALPAPLAPRSPPS